MSWVEDNNVAGIILFLWFFLLYGLEFLFPLMQRRSRHFWSNVSFALVLAVINIIFTSVTFLIAGWVDAHGIGLFNVITAETAWVVVISILFLDLWAGYVVHCFFHKYSWLWRLHSIHHSDDLVDVTTTFRQHPLESVIRIAFHLSGMAILGVPVWVLMIYLTLSTINAQIEHANISIPTWLDRILQYVFVTPNMHKIHHSRFQQETDSNFSNILSVWDRLFGTYRRLENYRAIDYGLDYHEPGRHFSFWELLKLPFRQGRG